MGNKKTKQKMGVAALAIMLTGTATMSYVKAETITTVRPGSTTEQGDADYVNWKTNSWTDNEDGALDSGKIMLTPGKTQSDMNMAWYSKTKGKPAVKLSLNSDMSDATIYNGTATDINKSNGANTYLASNKVTIENTLKEGKTYYYQYCDDTATNNYSAIYSFKTPEKFNNYKAILVGDPQIGASGSSGQSTMDDKNIAIDTYNWNKTLTTATTMFPNTSFILSAGDQIDYSSTNGYEIREREYAGFAYPSVLRSFPLAASIGNHESKGDDYQFHYNTPNASNLGATTSGGDYYYNYGNTLYMVLNTNNRNASEHDKFMEEAVKSNPDAKWKVVMFHHDIYGSASSHSDIDGANLRILFAPLMDKYDVDVCLTGHDHQYARTYQIVDGKVVDYNGDGSSVSDPEGTMYITAGSASGSKYYSLNKTAQYYLAERVSDNTPTFSTISVSDTSFKIETFDYNGNSYANPFTINKGDDKASVQELLKSAASIEKENLTQGSLDRVDTAVKNVNTLLDTRDDSAAIQKLSEEYQIDPNSGSLDYYGYATSGSRTLAQGFSKLLDKTLYEDAINAPITSADLTSARNNLQTALEQKITTAEVDKVNANILIAEDVLNKSVEGTAKGQYKVGSKAEFQKALETAKSEIAKTSLNKDELLKIDANVKEASTIFQNALITKDPIVTPEKPEAPEAPDTPVTPNTPEKPSVQPDVTQTGSSSVTASTPNTGDTNNMYALITSACLSLIGLGYFGIHKWRKNHASESGVLEEE